jgi:hypothetical protein
VDESVCFLMRPFLVHLSVLTWIISYVLTSFPPIWTVHDDFWPDTRGSVQCIFRFVWFPSKKIVVFFWSTKYCSRYSSKEVSGRIELLARRVAGDAVLVYQSYSSTCLHIWPEYMSVLHFFETGESNVAFEKYEFYCSVNIILNSTAYCRNL